MLLYPIDAIRIQSEKTSQSIGRDIGDNADGINAVTGLFDGLLVDICGKNLHRERLLQLLQLLLNEDGDGIGLLSGGTTAHPNPNRFARALAD